MSLLSISRLRKIFLNHKIVMSILIINCKEQLNNIYVLSSIHILYIKTLNIKLHFCGLRLTINVSKSHNSI